MRSPLNSSTGPQVLRFFDVCFKRGVQDAAALEDDYRVRDFVLKHEEDWSFGVLGEPDDFDWKLFRFVLYRWARAARLTQLAERYLFMIRAVNPYWAILPFCMRFYLMGVKEWLAYPNPMGLDVFRNTPKIHWAPQQGVSKKFTRPDYIAYMQEFSLIHRRLPEDRRLMNARTMDDYCMAIYDVSRCT